MFSSGRLARHAILAALIAAAASTNALVAPALAGTARSSAAGLEYGAFGGEANRALFVWDDDDGVIVGDRGTVVGGPGNDALTGEFLRGGPGNDRLAGTDAGNVLDGGPGADLLKGMG